MSGDLYTHVAVAQLYEGLMEYDYLQRPYQIKPMLATSVEASKDQKTYTFKIRDNVYFHDDPVFKGQKRKLTSKDIVFNFKRLANPKIVHNNWWVLQNMIEGLDELRSKWEKSNVNYEDQVSGLETPDDLTLIIKLKKPSRQFLYYLAMAPTMIVAPEAALSYGDDLVNHPVGTGPFVLKNWVRNQKLEFIKNPNYWGSLYPSQGSDDDQKEDLLEDAGKKLPLVDSLTIWTYVEPQTEWLNFLQKNLDVAGIPKDNYDSVIDAKGELQEQYKIQNLIMSQAPSADLVFFVFNMDDPVIGQNPFLRKAISMAISRKDKLKIFYNDRAIQAQGPIPPDIFGYDPNLRDPNTYDLDKAKAMFEKAKAHHQKKFGTQNIPPLLQDIHTGTHSRQFADAIDSDLKQIGYSSTIRVGTWTQFADRMAKRQGQFYAYAWNADYPDPENFLQLLYSKNASPGPNHANLNHPQYDALYEQMKDEPDGPKRQELIKQMVTIIHEQTPWVLFNHRISVSLRHPWLKNHKRHAISPGLFKYLNIDQNKR